MYSEAPLLEHLDDSACRLITDKSTRLVLIEPIARVVSAVEVDFTTQQQGLPETKRVLDVIVSHWHLTVELIKQIDSGEKEMALIHLDCHDSLLRSHMTKEPDLANCRFITACRDFNKMAKEVLTR